MRTFIKLIFVASSLMLFYVGAAAQTEGYDVFNPIRKYITKGDADKLSAWFDDNLEIRVDNHESSASKTQAKQIMKAFFETYTPQKFRITHAAERANMKYVLGELSAGGESFSVTIFVSTKGECYKIQQLKIEH